MLSDADFVWVDGSVSSCVWVCVSFTAHRHDISWLNNVSSPYDLGPHRHRESAPGLAQQGVAQTVVSLLFVALLLWHRVLYRYHSSSHRTHCCHPVNTTTTTVAGSGLRDRRDRRHHGGRSFVLSTPKLPAPGAPRVPFLCVYVCVKP